MKRVKDTKQPDAILTGDIHLTESTPVSRIDDYLEAQKKKLLFLRKTQQKYDCPVLDSGDIFNYWKPSPWLMNRAYELLPENIITIPGNHDLPEHNIELYYKSGLHLLEEVEKLKTLSPGETTCTTLNNWGLDLFGFPYGMFFGAGAEEADTVEPYNKMVKDYRTVLILHEMVWPGETPPWPGAEGISATELLERYHENFDLILTGHNHTAFTAEYEGCLLVNPGPMMRISADKQDYKPCFYLYYTDTNMAEPIYYPIELGVHDDTHLTKPKDRDKRLSAYIEKMNMEWTAGFSFQDNLEAFFERNQTPRKIRELVWHSLEKEVD